MERVVRVARPDAVADAAAVVNSYDLDGIDLDVSGMSAAAYGRAADRIEERRVAVAGMHYGRTDSVSLQEWDLFRSQLDRVVDRADRFGAAVVSVHPPAAEINETHTVRDLQRFMGSVDDYVADTDVDLCVRLTGFMQDPEMLNLGLERLHRPSLAAMVDLQDLAAGVDPVDILRKFDVPVRKLRVPLTVAEMDEEVGSLPGDVMVVAEHPEI
ncbi:MAG: sugar phosphate isomerase/epimerase family protein [Candidatus Nanohaloarchaea archaeon]